jgi:dolichol-phosphate mannosyltransferase
MKPAMPVEAVIERLPAPGSATAGLRILVAVFCFNEHVKIERVLSRFPAERDYDVVVMNDGSTDDSRSRFDKFPFAGIITHRDNLGAGCAIRTVNDFALRQGYDVVVHVAGNDKDDPMLLPRLLQPIRDDRADYVQGSRYLPGGDYGDIPLYRIVATRFIHPWLFSMLVGRRIMDSTNGFRAFRTTLLRDARIDLDQDWLDKYELEPYFFYKAITLGYRVIEVPVTKFYPSKALGYTKMRPIIGWWSILRPLVFLGLRIKR